MERSKPRRRRNRGIERLKSILIVVLSLSAVYLTFRALVQNEVRSGSQGLLGSVLSLFQDQESTAPSNPTGSSELTAAARPVRIAVYDGVNRYAVQYNTAQIDKLFDSLGILLGEALTSAKAPGEITQQQWQAALQSPSVWFDFLGNIPLETLSAWTGGGSANHVLSGSARQIAVALDGQNVRLYYHNESDGLYYACETAVAYTGHMDELVSGYGGNGTFFVFELGEDSGYTGLDPYVLISASTPTPPVYRASNPLSSLEESLISELQEALSFQTASYPIPNGIRIREGQETLEINRDGTVVYSTAEDTASRYLVGDSDVTEVIETTYRLAADTVGRYCSAARLYLIGVEQTQAGMEVSYGYCLNGTQVSLSGGSYAARFTVRDGQITAFTLRFRRYEDGGEAGLPLLPERQAAAALEALQSEERELVLCYTDTSGETVQADWIAQ